MRISVPLILVFVALGLLLQALPVRAEEPSDVFSVYSDRELSKYDIYSYPTGIKQFYLPRNHEVKFDIHNGKFFKIEYWTFIHVVTRETDLDLNVDFYEPTGKFIATVRIFELTQNKAISIPHNANSVNYDRLVVIVKNRSNSQNKDFKFVVMDPVDPVKGVPIRKVNFKQLNTQFP